MRSAKRSRRAGRIPHAGFTLIEVLSALVILSIATVAAYATFRSQHASFTAQSRAAEAQQNLRDALEMVSRDIRLAGYGIPGEVNLPAGMLASGDNAIRNVVPLNRSTGPDDLVVLYAYDMDSGIPLSRLTAAMAAPGNVIRVDSVSRFAENDYIIISNGTSADLFQINGNPGGGILPHGNNGVNDPILHDASLPYVAGDTVSKARFVRYFIDDVTDPARPTLMLDKMSGAWQPLADDIEDMQFRYGLDTDGDSVVDTAVDAPGAGQIPRIRQVRLFFSARTRMQEIGRKDSRPALADRAAGPTDGFRRRILENVAIDIRNP